MTALMVAGTSSWAGKSVLATALCASLRRRGLRVAPFKAQNMSNNARVADGGEIGAAQYYQALAAGVVPSVDHNPVLVKPEADTRSQVIVLGQVDVELTNTPWPDRAPRLWDVVRDAYDRVAADADVVVVEGAGSPAEINLAEIDLANRRIGAHAAARTLVVCDIDRGGAFAHLFGTWSLLSEADRRRVIGFVLNRFRGDPSLLTPGAETLERLTGVPTLGIVPMVDHGLPDEDGAADGPVTGSGRRVRVVRGPGASNLDEWWPLREASDFGWATSPAQLSDAELIVIPGSKVVAADLAWMRATGMNRALTDAHRRGTPILAVCGGSQMVGDGIDDPDGRERTGRFRGLGLVPGATRFGAAKRVRRTAHEFRPDLPLPWAGLSGLRVDGYEIHFGETAWRPPYQPAFTDGTGFVDHSILAVYLHGLCEQPDVLEALAGRPPRRDLTTIVDGLADVADEHLDMTALLNAIGSGSG